nr:hypothetical protein [Tanacetum cinerariifolium]
LRVADSHTGNHRKVDFTPLETIRRFLSIIWEKIIRARRGGLRAKEEATSSSPSVECKIVVHLLFTMSAKDSIAIQTCELSEEVFDYFLALYLIPPKYEMAFRNFIYDENEENLSFLPKEPSRGFGNGSLFVLVNTDPLGVDAEPSLKLAEDTVDSGAVLSQREKAQEDECEELRSKCEAAITDFEKNPTVVPMREKLSTLSIEAKEHKANLDRMLLESLKWAGYHVSLSALESKVASLEADKARLEAVEASLKKEVDDVKRDKMEVVLKVVPYAVLKLVHSDELCSLVGKLVSSAILYRRCDAFEQVADMKEPFDLLKVKGYHPSYKKEHTQAGNELATASFSWLSEFIADPLSPIEVLLLKKLPALQRHVPLKTQVLVPAS